jgi:hypothetical protein
VQRWETCVLTSSHVDLDEKVALFDGFDGNKYRKRIGMNAEDRLGMVVDGEEGEEEAEKWAMELLSRGHGCVGRC